MNDWKEKILIVDDEKTYIDLLAGVLSPNYNICIATSGEQALKRLQSAELPDLILLDVMMPGMNGYDFCKIIKNRSNFAAIPIIFISALDGADQKVDGFKAGAVDFITKPIQAEEVLARVKTHLSITRQYKKLMENNTRLEALNQTLAIENSEGGNIKGENDNLSINPDTFILSFYKISIELTQLEFRLFHLLYSQPQRIYSRTQILDLVYPDMRDISDRTIDVHVKNIRNKIKKLGVEEVVIDSVYGAGYRYIPLNNLIDNQ